MGPRHEHPTFCKIIFTEYKGRYYGFRRLDHSLLKCGWANRKLSQKSRVAHAKEKATSLVYTMGGWPLL